MDRKTVFTKTAKGLMEATGKTSALSRDMRALLKEIDGKATVGDVQSKLGKVPEAKLQEALKVLAKSDYIREFTQAAQTAAPPPKGPAAGGDMNLDFTMAIPTVSALAKKAEDEARQKAQAAAEAAARAKAEADARAKDEAEARAKAVAAAAAARARAEAEARAKAEALETAKAAAAAEAAARAKAEAEARAKRDAEERARREAEERARVEAELKARLEEERKTREEAERKAKEEAERERKEAEEKARREADELRARLEEERKAREDAERKIRDGAERRALEDAEREAKKQAEREAKEHAERAEREAEERARKEAEDHAKAEAARKDKERAEREAKEHAERVEREAEERTRKDAEDRSRREAEERAQREAQEKREAEEKARKDAEEKARNEAEEKTRREAEAGARKDAEDRSRREAGERAQREAQEKRVAEKKARKDAEEKARREAEEQARLQAQAKSGPSLDDLVSIETDFDAVLGTGAAAKDEAAKVSAAADDKVQQEAEAKARREAEERERSVAQERARDAAEAERRRKDEVEQEQGQEHVAEQTSDDVAAWEREYAKDRANLNAQNAETERHFAEMEKELEAEEAAAKEQKAPPELPLDTGNRSRDEAREPVRAGAAVHAMEAEAAAEEVIPVYRTPINWGKPVALGLFLLLLASLVLIHVVSFDGYIPQFEKLAGAHLQQPVKIKALHLSLVPTPHWRLDGVSVGNEGQLVAAQINAVAELGSLFGDKKVFRSIELVSPVLSEAGLAGLLFGKPQGEDFKVENIIVKNGKIDSKTIILPAMDARIAVGEDGAWQKIALDTPDHKTSLTLNPGGEGVQFEFETNAFSTVFDPGFILENFSAKGVIGRNELRLSEFKGGIYDGYLSGNARLKWGTDWSLGGELSVRAMDPGIFAPALLAEGKLEGKAVYAMRAKSYDGLFAAPRLEGTFAVRKGSLLGVDLGLLLQGGGIGGKTAFTELSGNFVRDGGRIQLQQVRLSASPVSASGSADADARKNVGGRFTVELKSTFAQARANVALSGTLKEPRFSR